jgi:predicted phosphohydrolase
MKTTLTEQDRKVLKRENERRKENNAKSKDK